MWKIISKLLGLRTGLDADSDSKLQWLGRWQHEWMLVVLLVVVVVYYAWQYRKDARRLTGGRRRLLTVLRVLVIGMIILMLIKPALSIAQLEKRTPYIAVLFDESASMDYPDAPDSPLINRNELDFLRASEESKKKCSRLTGGRTILSELISQVKPAINEQHNVVIYKFSGPREQLLRVPVATEHKTDLDQAGRDVLAAVTGAIGSHTNLGDALVDVRRDLAGNRVSAVLVISDFRDTSTPRSGAMSIEDAAFKYQEDKVPVSAFVLGDVKPLRDVIFADLIAPKEANLDDVLRMQAIIINNLDAPLDRLDLTIKDSFESKDKKIIDQFRGEPGIKAVDGPDGTVTFTRTTVQRVDLRKGQNDVGITLLAKAPEGDHKYTVNIPVQPQEYNPNNNEQSAFVKIVKRTLRVLFIAGEPTIEYHYLWPALVRDPIVDVSCWLQDADVNYVQQGNRVIEQLPNSIEEWNKYDVVVLYDIDPEKFSNEQETGLEQLINQGGGLFMIAGRTHGLDKLLTVRTAKMKHMLPVEIDLNKHPDYMQVLDKPIKCVRTRDGEQHPVFMYDMIKEENDKVWSSFPQLYWAHPTLGLKLKAISLLERVDEAPDSTDGRVLMATWRYGLGSVFYSGIHELWRWRYPMESFDYDRFFVQIIRYLGEVRLLGSQKQVVLTTDRKAYTPGSEVKIALQVLDPATLNQLKSERNVQVTVNDPEGGTFKVSMVAPTAANDANFWGRYKPKRVGEYSIQAEHALAEGDSAAKSLYDETTHFKVNLESLEFIDTTANIEGARRLAELTGGKMYDHTTMNNRGDLMESISAEPQKLARRVMEDVWDSPLFLLAVLMLISSEWILRKKWSLL